MWKLSLCFLWLTSLTPRPVLLVDKFVRENPKLFDVWHSLSAGLSRFAEIQWSNSEGSERSGLKISLSRAVLDLKSPPIAILLRLGKMTESIDTDSQLMHILAEPDISEAQFIKRGTHILMNQETRMIKQEIALAEKIEKLGFPAFSVLSPLAQAFRKSPELSTILNFGEGAMLADWHRELVSFWVLAGER